jgi:DNA ligase-associated metallophosphoesterase
MNDRDLSLNGAVLTALPSGALWWRAQDLLCVSDLHLGKAERHARRGGSPLPPYEIRETLDRLRSDLDETGAQTVICLGDSFDDLQAAQALPEDARQTILALQSGRRWIWIEGNHDPGPLDIGGEHCWELPLGPLVFRHIAEPDGMGEISGHYHPKVALGSQSRPAFLLDSRRLILPAYGTYTGGLRSTNKVLSGLMGPDAVAILTGKRPHRLPMPR